MFLYALWLGSRIERVIILIFQQLILIIFVIIVYEGHLFFRSVFKCMSECILQQDEICLSQHYISLTWDSAWLTEDTE